MKDSLLEYKRLGKAMTCKELAELMRVSTDTVRRLSQPPYGTIPRIPGVGVIRFDPSVLIEVLCSPPKAKEPRSLTIERHKTGARPIGGYRKCL